MSNNAAPGLDYFRWFYDDGVWKRMHYRGVRILKFPSDLWNYREIFSERRVDWVIETGTRHGGSALYFADLLQLNGASGRVISIDVDAVASQVRSHPRIDFLLGDSGAPETAEQVRARIPPTRGTLFMILDADHRKAHVLRELAAWVPLLRRGDYLIVEDSCVTAIRYGRTSAPVLTKRSRSIAPPTRRRSSAIWRASRNSASPSRRAAT